MPSDRSLYRKIQIVLEIAKSAKVATLDDLKDEVTGEQRPSFNTFQYDNETDEFVWRQSATAISRTVRFCRRLGFFEDDGRLTKLGRQAARKTQYDRVLAARARSVLEQAGVDLQQLNKIIQRSLRSEPPVLPTSSELWDAMDCEIGKADFSRILTLLAHCGAAESSQKKIYLHFPAA